MFFDLSYLNLTCSSLRETITGRNLKFGILPNRLIPHIIDEYESPVHSLALKIGVYMIRNYCFSMSRKRFLNYGERSEPRKFSIFAVENAFLELFFVDFSRPMGGAEP